MMSGAPGSAGRAEPAGGRAGRSWMGAVPMGVDWAGLVGGYWEAGWVPTGAQEDRITCGNNQMR